MNKKTERQNSPDHTSPYPVSRLAPAFNPVDLAQEIAQADVMLANRAGSQLKIIAEQMAGRANRPINLPAVTGSKVIAHGHPARTKTLKRKVIT
ncbi:MAG: DUF2452 domain-containing protein [Candidatus Thiodiazotropha lotti]|nr:DUF2452 domain-containing protein [Candidatus Thiodiazotropha lotti]